MRVHVPFQVLLTVLRVSVLVVQSGARRSAAPMTHLEDENELALGVDDVVEANDVDVLELCAG